MGHRSFLGELKRRNVLRAAVLYIGAVWALAQGIASLGPAFGVPDWVTRAIVLIGGLGFPFWLMFAWYYELTPEGLKRESDVAPSESITTHTGRKLDFLIIAVLGVAVALLLADRFFLHRGSAEVAVAEKSIAVLPFANTSGDPGNEYFSDGMSEELINALGRLQDLTVIGRSSSVQFKGKGEDAKTVGAKLGVAYLLEGSVRKAEDKVRIAVELVKAANGASVWSETYDRDLRDIFALQSDIAMQVAGKLKSTLLATTDSGAARELKPDAPPTANVAAYNALLQGNFYFERRTEVDVRKAIALYEQATQLDPRYALAHAKLAYARTELDASFTTAAGDAREALQADVRRALATARDVDPESPDVHLAQGYAMEALNFDLAAAAAEYRRAAKLAPQNPAVALRLALIQSYTGEFEASVAGLRHMLLLDPLSGRGHQFLGMVLGRLGRYAEAEVMLRQGIELQPQAAVQHAYLTCVLIAQGRNTEALTTAKQEPDEFWRNWALALAQYANGDLAASDQALAWLVKNDPDDGASQIAQIYAQRKQPDDAFKWLDHGIDAHDGGMQQIRLSLFLVPYEKDTRYEAIARKVRVWNGPERGLSDPPKS